MPELTAVEIAALQEALDDGYRAWSTCDQVVHDFGEVRPFVNVRSAEARQIDALLELFAHYDLEAPVNTWPERVKHYRRVRDACNDAVESAIYTATLYDRLLASTSRPDLLRVFGQLKAASVEHHLPAFQQCIGRPVPRHAASTSPQDPVACV
jgi:hypothetical protein